jgi:hypothetical protein
MALWQFSMHLVPRTELARLCPDLKTPIPGDEFDAVAWWSTSQPVSDIPERLKAVLPEVQGWDSGSRQWGPDDATTVSVSYADGRVDGVWVRLDLRQQITAVVDALVRLSLDCDAWWVGGDAVQRSPVGQRREELLSAIRTSDAARFVLDPRGYLADLAKARERTTS